MYTEVTVRACPVFVRWQIYCPRCQHTFYLDAELGTAEEEIKELPQMQCGFHPEEGAVTELV
jgi:phage terminase large subunit GpA-like protein